MSIEWVDNRVNGKGKGEKSNGDRYVDEFKNYKFHVEDVYFCQRKDDKRLLGIRRTNKYKNKSSKEKKQTRPKQVAKNPTQERSQPKVG